MIAIIKAMFSKVFGFFGLDKLSLYFILGLIALIGIITIYNSDAILSRFGFETISSLKAKVAQLQEQNQQLVQANNQLKGDLEKLEERNKIELENMKKHYEYKIAQYEKVIKAQKDLKEKNIQLTKELEEQRKNIANICKINEKDYYLYSAKTYDELSSNNYEAILAYIDFKPVKDLTPTSEKVDNSKKFFSIDFNELKHDMFDNIKPKIDKPSGDLK